MQIYRESCKVSPTMTDTPDGCFISVYAGERTKKGVADVTAKIVKAFPGWSSDQTEILKDRFAENGFTDRRMMDAVNFVIDNYEGYGKIPNIANFIKYDKTALTYAQICTAHDKGELVFADYEPIDLGHDNPRFARREDVEKFNLKKWGTR